MSVISAPQLLVTPKGYPPGWQRVFEDIVSPINLVRDIGHQVGINSLRFGKKCLSVEDLWLFARKAISVRQRIQNALNEVDGVAEKTWRAGCEIRTVTGFVLHPLIEDIYNAHLSWDALLAALYEKYSTSTAPRFVRSKQRKRVEVSFFASALDRVIENSCGLRPIPLLLALRDSISAEKVIDLPDTAPRAPAITKKTKRRRGRPEDTNRREDAQIFDAWKTGQYRGYKDLASQFQKKCREVRRIIDRESKRRKIASSADH
ncbi:MAG TPA: hypothetical protein VFE62_00200 [Gemmataceae bacterium]|nr:hypothetical protein [Gemmataceae bacterium]